MDKEYNLRDAKKIKNDEFYTPLETIEREIPFYKDFLKGKSIYCNCDNPEFSNFWKYFHTHFKELELKKLVATFYSLDTKPYKMEYTGEKDEDIKIGEKTYLGSNGDFRSLECTKVLRESDVVITNPPFSLFREYINHLAKYNKSFLVIGNKNSLIYKNIFSLFMNNKLWIGNTNPKKFILPNGELTTKLVGLCKWFTNIDCNKRHERLILNKEYNNIDYLKFDNYEAINVDKVSDIPKNYNDLMGVPITFIDHYNPEQFDIIDGIGRYSVLNNEETLKNKKYLSMVNGKAKYFRVIIRRKN